MTIIDIEKLNDLTKSVELWKEQLDMATAKMARARSEKGFLNAGQDAEYAIENLKKANAELLAYQAEITGIIKNITEANEVVLMWYWTDEYGFQDSETYREVYSYYESAYDRYNKLKNNNGSYVWARFEVREAGETKRIEKLKAKIAKLEAELKELEGEE